MKTQHEIKKNNNEYLHQTAPHASFNIFFPQFAILMINRKKIVIKSIQLLPSHRGFRRSQQTMERENEIRKEGKSNGFFFFKY